MPTQLQISYAKTRDARGRPTETEDFILTKHMNLFSDQYAQCMVIDAKLELVGDDQQVALLPVHLYHPRGLSTRAHVDPSTVRPLSSMTQYEIDRLSRIIENERKLDELGLGKGLTTPPMQTKKPREPKAPPRPVQRATRQSTAAATAAAIATATLPAAADRISGPSDSPSSSTAPAAAAVEEDDDNATQLGSDVGGGDDLGDAGVDFGAPTSSLPTGLEALIGSIFERMFARFSERDEANRQVMIDDFRLLLGAATVTGKRGCGRTSGSPKKKSKVARHEEGFYWSTFEDYARVNDLSVEDISEMLMPFLTAMGEHYGSVLMQRLGPRTPQLTEEDVMTVLYQGIEGVEPSAPFLVELVNGGRYAILRQGAHQAMRYLRRLFFSDIATKFEKSVTDASIEKGTLFDTEALFTSPWAAPTLLETYGVNNRSETKNVEFRVASLSQHLPAWSETTESQNLSTGRIDSKPYAGDAPARRMHRAHTCLSHLAPCAHTSHKAYSIPCRAVGGPILEGFIKRVSEDGELPSLDCLSVLIAYVTAKKHGINVGHGFDLKSSSGDWKNWCVAPQSAQVELTSFPTAPSLAEPCCELPSLSGRLADPSLLLQSGSSARTRVRRVPL